MISSVLCFAAGRVQEPGYQRAGVLHSLPHLGGGAPGLGRGPWRSASPYHRYKPCCLNTQNHIEFQISYTDFKTAIFRAFVKLNLPANKSAEKKMMKVEQGTMNLSRCSVLVSPISCNGLNKKKLQTQKIHLPWERVFNQSEKSIKKLL